MDNLTNTDNIRGWQIGNWYLRWILAGIVVFLAVTTSVVTTPVYEVRADDSHLVKEPPTRHYYLCTLIGDGSFSNPFAPVVSLYSDSYGMIDLRADSTKIGGYGLAYADTVQPISIPQAILIADSIYTSKTVGIESTSQYLNRILGADVSATKPNEYLSQLLRSPPKGLCPPLQPSKDGDYRIYLGGQIYGKAPPLLEHHTLTESFTGTGAAMGADLAWTEVAGDFERLNDVLNVPDGASGTLTGGRVDTALSTYDHYAQLTITSESHGAIGPAVSFKSDALTCYWGYAYTYSSQQKLDKVVSGSQTNLGTTSLTESFPEPYKLEKDGSSLIFYQNGVDKISSSDSSFEYNQVGVMAWKSTGGDVARGDDFEADDLEAGVAAPTVVTNTAQSVEEITVTLSGNITATGGANATLTGFEWGTTTANYTANQTSGGNFGVGNFTEVDVGMDAGEGYFGRALAVNEAGAGYGDEIFWLMKPVHATNFIVTDNGSDWLTFELTQGSGTDYVEVRYSTEEYPTDNTDGSLGYWGNESTGNISDLSCGQIYYLKAFEHATENGQWSTSDDSPTAVGQTDACPVYNVPTVVTDNATNVEETSATLNGQITNTGGASCNQTAFEYDIDSGAPYTYEITDNGTFEVGAFSINATGLDKGELYYFRARATNTENATPGYGDELKFLTKPDSPSNFNGEGGIGQIDIEWDPSEGADTYLVIGKEDSYPEDREDGTEVYSGADNMTTHSGLEASESWYYKIWAYCTEGELEQWSDSYTFGYATTSANTITPTVTTSDATNVEETTATAGGNLTDAGGENCTVEVWYDTDLAYPLSENWTSPDLQEEGEFSTGLTGLNKGDKYIFHASANNTAGSANGTDKYFMTKSDPVSSANATDTGTDNISLGWINGEGMDIVQIWYLEGDTAPTDNTSGTLGYSGNLTSANIDGLDPGTEYSFLFYGLAFDTNTWSVADNNPTVTASTDVASPTITTGSATGVTDNDAILNATVTEDGGASCNITWYWGETDYGEDSDNWTNSYTSTGESEGAASHTITDNLTPDTLYHWIVYIVNEAGSSWGSSANFTTTEEITNIGAPTGLTLTDLGANNIRVDWTKGLNSTYTHIQISRTRYPTDNETDELLYYGSAETCNITGWDLEIITPYVSAWGVHSDNTTYSSIYTTGTIGGTGMWTIVLAFLPLGLTVAGYGLRRPGLAMFGAGGWFVFGIYCYQTSVTTWDTWYALFILACIFTVAAVWEAATLRASKTGEEVGDVMDDIDLLEDEMRKINKMTRLPRITGYRHTRPRPIMPFSKRK